MGEQTIAAIVGSLVGGGIIVAVVIIIAFVIFREAISAVVKERLQKFDYSRGDTKLSVDLTAPQSQTKPISEVQSQAGTEQDEPAINEQQKQIEEITATVPESSTEWQKELFKELYSDAPDFERAEKLYLRVQADELDPLQRLRNESIYWYLRQQKGDIEALRHLKELPGKAKAFPEVVSDMYFFLGIAYTSLGGWLQALDTYRLVVETAHNEQQKASGVRQVSFVQLRLGHPEEALKTVLDAISTIIEKEALATCYQGLAHYYEKQKNHRLRALALEKSLEYDSHDLHVRFEVARAYSDADLHELSVLHYVILLQTSPRYSYALNNLGVEYDNLKMPTLAVSAYSQSIDQGNTLSAANLANAYLNAGFVDDAKRILDEAIDMEDVHKNVPLSLGNIARRQLADEEAKERSISNAQEQQQFAFEYARAYFASSNIQATFSGLWQTNDGDQFTVTQHGTKILGQWERFGTTFTFEGVVRGRALEGVTVSRKEKNSYYSSKDIEKGEGYLSEDGQVIKLFEVKPYGNTTMTYYWVVPHPV